MKMIRQSQKGAVLFVALIFLLVLTVLALAASSSSIMQERMTGGMRNRQLSLVGADTALRGGERYLWKLNFQGQQPFVPCVNSGQSDCVYRSIEETHLDAQRFRTDRTGLTAGVDSAREYDQVLENQSGDSITAQIAGRPRYIIEEVGMDLPNNHVYVGSQIGRINPDLGTRVGDRVLYRVTARSWGGTDATLTIMESVYSSADLTNTGFNP